MRLGKITMFTSAPVIFTPTPSNTIQHRNRQPDPQYHAPSISLALLSESSMEALPWPPSSNDYNHTPRLDPAS
jgi:hypothetical protein